MQRHFICTVNICDVSKLSETEAKLDVGQELITKVLKVVTLQIPTN